MQKITNLLDGRKTFIGIVLGVIYSIVVFVKPELNNEVIWALIVGWTGVSYRLAINKV